MPGQPFDKLNCNCKKATPKRTVKKKPVKKED